MDQCEERCLAFSRSTLDCAFVFRWNCLLWMEIDLRVVISSTKLRTINGFVFRPRTWTPPHRTWAEDFNKRTWWFLLIVPIARRFKHACVLRVCVKYVWPTKQRTPKLPVAIRVRLFGQKLLKRLGRVNMWIPKTQISQITYICAVLNSGRQTKTAQSRILNVWSRNESSNRALEKAELYY